MRSCLAFLSLVALLSGLASGTAGAQQAAVPAPAPPKAVLELFTSQGCASCPPADALLEDLAKDPDVIAITLAVDYWDYIGWKDTLAKHGHSLRQKAYAEQRGDRMIYTPQIIVDGIVPAKGSDKTAIQKAMARARDNGVTLSVPLKLSVKGNDLVIDVSGLAQTPAHAGLVSGDIWVCPVIRAHEVAIGRGENAGKTVTYTNVVRGWVRLGPWTGHAATFTVPLDRVRQDNEDGVVVMLQAGSPVSPGPILGAARLALN